MFGHAVGAGIGPAIRAGNPAPLFCTRLTGRLTGQSRITPAGSERTGIFARPVRLDLSIFGSVVVSP
jgi:hypothetical protein